MAKLSSIRTDFDKVTKGVWFPFEHGIELLIARSRNPALEAFIAQKTSPEAKAALGKKELETSDYEQISQEATARFILLGWKNVDDEGEYTWERGFEILKDPAYEDLYRFVTLKSNQTEKFRVDALEEIAKN